MFIKVHVVPDSKKELIEQSQVDVYNVYVREPREQNRANKRTIELLREHKEFAVYTIRLVRGHHQPHKLFELKPKKV